MASGWGEPDFFRQQVVSCASKVLTVPMDMELVEVKTPYCMVCGLRNIITVTATAWARYASGTLIQDAFPEMSYDDREMLISGTHPKCWEVLHDEDYDDM